MRALPSAQGTRAFPLTMTYMDQTLTGIQILSGSLAIRPERSLRTAFQDFGNVYAEGCGQVVLVFLLLGYDLA